MGRVGTMAGYGTGVPLWFKCPTERDEYNQAWSRERAVNRGTTSLREIPYPRRHKITRTGKTKASYQRQGNHHPRTLFRAHQYQCHTCGHVGWTILKDVMRCPLEDTP